MKTQIAALFVCVLLVSANAHDGVHDDFLKSLTNQQGGSCCDGSDAFSVLDPDWDIKDGHYVVNLNGTWINVPDEAVVKQANRIGIAKVWPVDVSGKTLIRCFMPGSGA